VRVAELLLDGHTSCVEELGVLVIAYERINRFFAGLKQGRTHLMPGKSAEAMLEENHAVYTTFGVAFEHAATEFLSAEWPRSRPDVWQENHDKLARAVTAYTERLTTLYEDHLANLQ